MADKENEPPCSSFSRESKREFGTSSKVEQDKIIADAVPKNTKSATDYWIRMFQDFCKDDCDLATISIEKLASLVGSFYSDARTKKGNSFSKNSILAARGALQRHLGDLRQINIYTDISFSRANKLLDGVLKARKQAGEEPAVKHKEPISEQDWEKLQTYFSDVAGEPDAVKLTYYIWYQITVHFCLRGGEMQAKLTKKDLEFSTIDGREVLRLATSFVSKNHQGGLAGSDWSSSGVITDESQLNIIKLYLSKLNPDEDRLFQRALTGRKLTADCPCWFARAPLSHNLLSQMMKRLSAAANLSTAYTNHCVRATSITSMKQAGIDDRRICSVSGHRNIQSLTAYDRPTTADSCAMAAAIDHSSSGHATAASSPGSAAAAATGTSVSSHNASAVSSSVSATAAAVGSAVSNATFSHSSIVFNIHHARAAGAREKLKRKRSSSSSSPKKK